MRIPDDDGSDCALPQYTLLFYSILLTDHQRVPLFAPWKKAFGRVAGTVLLVLGRFSSVVGSGGRRTGLDRVYGCSPTSQRGPLGAGPAYHDGS